MKIKSKILIVLVGALIMGAHVTILALCKIKDNAHKEKATFRCWYTKKELKKINKKNKPRRKEMGVSKHQCFYCGCPVDEHSDE